LPANFPTPFILHPSAFILFIFPRAIDRILDAIIGYSLSGSPRGAEGRGAPETKWSLLFPASYNNQSTCAIIIEARYDHSPDSFSKEAHT
jgi:hypothetical protein